MRRGNFGMYFGKPNNVVRIEIVSAEMKGTGIDLFWDIQAQTTVF